MRRTLSVFFTITLALLHRLFQFFLVIRKQSMNLAVRFIADSVNLRTKLLPRSFRILIEQRLNPIVVLLKQGPNLALLFRSQLQIFCKASKFLTRSIAACGYAVAAHLLRAAVLHPGLQQDRSFRA